MKSRPLQVMLISMLLIVVMAFQAGCAAAPREVAQAQEPANERTLHVNGTGRVSAEPDEATITLGVETEGEEATAAMEENNTRMQALIDALQEAGVLEENIQTETIRLSPRYEEPPEPRPGAQPTLTGFRAVNTVSVRVTDIQMLGDLLSAAVEAGGNRVQSIQFEVSDATTYLEQAREAAWNDAEQKASQLAELAGASLGEVLTIDETSRAPGPVVRQEVEMAAGAAVPVQPGSETIEVEISITWRLQ